MNCRERVLLTLDHNEPDRIPYYEHAIQQPKLAIKLRIQKESKLDLNIILNLLRNKNKLSKTIFRLLTTFGNNPKILKPLVRNNPLEKFKLFMKMGVDLSAFNVLHNGFHFIPPNRLVSGFGQIYEFKFDNGAINAYYEGGFFKTKEDYYRSVSKLNSSEPLGHLLYKNLIKKVDFKKIFIMPGFFTGLFDSTWQGFGIETFSRFLVKDPTFIKKVVHDRELLFSEVIKSIIDEFQCDLFFIGDDLAYNSGPFISPRYFNNIFLPSYKRISKIIHKRGVKIVFHSDGDIRPILDGLINCFDAIHPWQVSANIDIFQIKEKYGDKICILGNVPIELLVHKTKKEISNYVRELIKKCGPGGGYMMSSGNSIVREVPWQNYLTMLNTYRKYRDYPINVN